MLFVYLLLLLYVYRAGLETGLECKNCMLSLHVTNGTEWLHLGGEIDKFLPIVTAPVQSVATSDLSLDWAVSRILDTRKEEHPLGIFIFFSTHSVIPQALDVLSSIWDQEKVKFPILLATNIYSTDSKHTNSTDNGISYSVKEFLSLLDEKFPVAIPVVGWETYHGMDKVWQRVRGKDNFKEKVNSDTYNNWVGCYMHTHLKNI